MVDINDYDDDFIPLRDVFCFCPIKSISISHPALPIPGVLFEAKDGGGEEDDGDVDEDSDDGDGPLGSELRLREGALVKLPLVVDEDKDIPDAHWTAIFERACEIFASRTSGASTPLSTNLRHLDFHVAYGYADMGAIRVSCDWKDGLWSVHARDWYCMDVGFDYCDCLSRSVH